MKPPRQFKSRLNKHSAGWASSLLIIILALILVALFFAAFRIVPYDMEIAADEPSLEVVMIDPSDLEEEYGRNIMGWSVIKDPTVMTQPDSELGFSVIRQYSPALPFADQQYLSLLWPPRKYRDMPVKTPDYLPLSAFEWRLGGEDWQVFLPAGRRFVQQTLPQEVIWRLPGGRKIEDPPEIDLEIIQEKARNTELEQPTILEIIAGQGGEHYRIIVRESCGSSELDQLAIEALRTAFFEKRQHPEAENDQQDTFSGPPKPKPGTSIRVEVEWRLVTS